MRKYNLILLFIILWGSFLRFYRLPETAMFVGDQARDYFMARDILLGHKLPIVGPQTSISWLHLGPFFYYFLAFFLWLGRFNPIWPVYGTTLFGVLAIYLIYHLGKRLFSEGVGLLSAFFYAISPFAILQSRISLHPSIYPVFVIVFLLSLGKLLKRGGVGGIGGGGEKKYWVWLAIAFLISVQLHLSAVLLVPIFVLSWEQIKLKPRYFSKLFLTAVGLVVVWKIFNHSPFTPFSFWWKILQEIFCYGCPGIDILALLFIVCGVTQLRKRAEAEDRIIFTSLLVIILGLTAKNSQAEHYFNLLLPVIILIFGVGVVELYKTIEYSKRFFPPYLLSRWTRNYTSIIAVFILTFFLVPNIYNLISTKYFSDIHGPGLAERIKLAKFIVEDASVNLFVLKRCGPLWDFISTNMNYEYLVWWLGRDKEDKGDKVIVTYYIFEPKLALDTFEGCSELQKNFKDNKQNYKIFEFPQAYVLKLNNNVLIY